MLTTIAVFMAITWVALFFNSREDLECEGLATQILFASVRTIIITVVVVVAVAFCSYGI